MKFRDIVIKDDNELLNILHSLFPSQTFSIDKNILASEDRVESISDTNEPKNGVITLLASRFPKQAFYIDAGRLEMADESESLQFSRIPTPEELDKTLSKRWRNI